MKKLIFVLVISLFVSACAQPTPSANAINTAIAQTQIAQPSATNTIAPTETPIPSPTKTLSPTNTPRPTNTKAPTATLEPTLDIDTTQSFAKNYLASQDIGGVIVEIVRVLIANKDAVGQDYGQSDLFNNKPVVVEVVIKVVNNTDQTINLYADQGTIAVNGEQISLFDYSLEGAKFGDDLGGEFLPGVTAIGGIWVGVKRTPLEEINKIIVKIDHPSDENFNRLGADYFFDIDVKDWGFEPMPDEMQ